jgi:ribose transport system permease protein
VKRKIDLKALVPYLGLIAIILIFSIASGNELLSSRNIKVIINQMLIIMIGALGSSFVLAIGKLDFSLGSLVGVTATVGCLVSKSFGILPALLAVLVIGALTGVLIGGLHALFQLNPFIISITILFMYRGLTWILNKDSSIALPFSMYQYDKLSYRVVIALLVFVIVYILFNKTKFGKYCKAVGSGEMAALQSGVPVNQVKVIAYSISGLFGGLCGLLSLIKSGTSFTTTGQMFETEVLIALVLGGMPLSGGLRQG